MTIEKMGNFSAPVLGNLIDGSFRFVNDPNGSWMSRSPADLSDELGQFHYSYASVDQAVQAARAAFASWRKTSPEDRLGYLKKLEKTIKKRTPELVQFIAREIGKPLWEAEAELAETVLEFEASLQASLKATQDFRVSQSPENVQGVCRYRPLGVAAVVGPFNLPCQLPCRQIIPALATGNTVVFKPSEKAPLVSQILAECFEHAGFPRGVFNMIQGEREVGRRLCVHEAVDAVLFTGSSEVGGRIKQDTLQQHWKLLALEMGGKNPIIVWDDADLESAVFASTLGAFATTGQRCTSTARAIVHRKILPEFVSRMHARAKAFSIGHPLENPFMGPLVEAASVDRYMKFLGIATREGAEMVMRGKALELGKNGNYVTPSICLVGDSSVEAARKSIYQQTEFFSPNLAILGVDDLEEAFALANVTQYGLVASVFTKSREIFEKSLDELQFGLLHWNQPTLAASTSLPIGGFKKSGNHFPAGSMSFRYCTAPVASLECAEPRWLVKPPGLNESH